MSRGRIHVLLALGHRSRGTALSGLVHRVGLGVAAGLTMLAVWALLAAHAEIDASHARILSREPRPTNGGPATAYWLAHADHLDDRQFLTIYIAPIRSNASPPPGLSRWPRPGEYFMSPALAAADAADDGVVGQRYGRSGGVIGLNGLTDPGEWLMYVRPVRTSDLTRPDNTTLISGLGRPAGYDGSLETLNASPHSPDEIYRLILICLILPALVFLIVAIRGASEQRDRRVAMLDALGGSRWSTGWVLIGEAAMPVLIGTLSAAAAAIATTMYGLKAPIVGYQIMSSDLSGVRFETFVVWALSVAGILTAVRMSHMRREARRSTRPRNIRNRRPKWLVGVCVIAFIVCAWIANEASLRGGAHGKSPLILAFFLALLVVLTTLPAAIASGVALIGAIAASIGRRRGWLGALVGGRWLAARPAGLARVCAAAVVGLGVLAVLQVWVSQYQDAGASTEVRQDIGERIVSVQTVASNRQSADFQAAIGREAVVWVGENSDGDIGLVGDCAALSRIGQMRCPAAPAPASNAFHDLTPIGVALNEKNASILVSGDPIVSTESVKGFDNIGFLVFNDAAKPGVDAIANTAYRLLPLPQISDPGQYSVAGAIAEVEPYKWLWIMTASGALILLISALMAAVDVVLTQTRSVGVLGTISAGRRLYIGMATWSIGLPVIVATIAGTVVAAQLGHMFARLSGNGVVSVSLLLTTLGAMTALTVVQTAFCAEAVTRSARRWRPVSD